MPRAGKGRGRARRPPRRGDAGPAARAARGGRRARGARRRARPGRAAARAARRGGARGPRARARASAGRRGEARRRRPSSSRTRRASPTRCWPASARAGAFSLTRVINATGVVLHTNLGRALLSPLAVERLAVVAGGYSNLEMDIAQKERGSRYAHVDGLLRRLTGAEGSLVVNNCASAVLLALETPRAGQGGHRLARRADRDRRRVPHPRHHAPLGRGAARGGRHQPDASQGLRRAPSAPTRGCS